MQVGLKAAQSKMKARDSRPSAYLTRAPPAVAPPAKSRTGVAVQLGLMHSGKSAAQIGQSTVAGVLVKGHLRRKASGGVCVQRCRDLCGGTLQQVEVAVNARVD
jgi:hypothetical protein